MFLQHGCPDIEAGASLVHSGQVSVAEDGGLGVFVAEAYEQLLH